MNCFMRPYIRVGIALLGATITLTPATMRAQLTRIAQIIDEPKTLLHSGVQGYLGVLVGDVDNDSAAKLKLKETRGAVVTLIDHDAPAAQVGLRVNDVLLEVNGQTVEGAEAFGRMMREIPPGRKITLLISRDGATQTLTVELADRKKLDTDIWNKLNSGGDTSSPVLGLGILGTGGAGDAPLPGGFHIPFVGSSTLKVGALVEPLTAQMADYLGVPNGLMVKQVARKSQAAVAGMKAFDVILKVGTDSISTVSDWDRAMRANQGKNVAVTILRDKKQQTLTLLVNTKKTGEVDFDELFPNDNCPLLALADPDVFQDLSRGMTVDPQTAETLQQQALELQEQLKNWKDQSGSGPLQFAPEQAEEFRKQAEQWRDAFNGQSFGVDPKQMEKLQQQMQEWRQFDGKPLFDEKQMEQFKQQMDEFQKNFAPQQMQHFQMFDLPGFDRQQRELLKEQMDELMRQMNRVQKSGFDHIV